MAMLLSSLDIHRPNVLRVTSVLFFLYGSAVERRTYYWKVGGSNASGGNHLSHAYHSSVLFSGMKHLLDISFSLVGFKFFAILAVANFANINSNE